MDKKKYENEIVNAWVEPNEPDEVVNKRFSYLNERASIVYDFILSYSAYLYKKRDYSIGIKLSMMEAHILIDIADNLEVTVTKLAKKWKKTSSAISQIVKRLIKWGFVYRVNYEGDRKYYHLYPTEKGKKIALKHKEYDNIDIIKTNKRLLRKFTVDEMLKFEEILIEYTKLLEVNK